MVSKLGETKYLTKKEFRKLQLTELEMLKEFDKVCRKHNIKYSIWGGTLLGAVRHKGFIPWDDDIDVVMLRKEYNKFTKVANELDPNNCYYQDNNTDPYYRWGYGKLRKTNTIFIRVGQEHIKCKTGIFMDLFPLDGIPNSIIGQILNDFHCFCIRKMMYSEVGMLSKNENCFTRSMYKFLSKIPLKKVFKIFNKIIRKYENKSTNMVRTYSYTSIGKLYGKHPLKEKYGMPRKWFEKLIEYEFEGSKFFGCKDYDKILTFIYGDYMKLPPKDKRDPHAPVSKISFNINE